MAVSANNRQRGVGTRSLSQLLIVMTMLLAGAFVLGVWNLARVQRDKVAMATCYFAADASRVLQARSRLFLEMASGPIFGGIGGRVPLAPGAPLPPPAALAAAAAAVARCHCAPQLPVRDYVRLDFEDSTGGVGSLLLEPARATPLGTDPPGHDADSVGIRDAITRMLPMIRNGGVIAAPVTRTASYTDTLRSVAIISPTFWPDGRIRAVYGLIVTPRDFATSVVAPVFERVPIFPMRLSDENRRSNRDLANLAVLDYRYTPLYQTGPMADTASGCVGMAQPEAAMALMLFHLSPPPKVAARWTDEAIAESGLPLLGMLLAGMLACGGAAVLAARHESELAALRSDFVTGVSHELRMPLAQILLSAETLSLGRTRSDAERDDAADAIVREAQRLTGVVDNVLFFSRIERHNARITPEPTDLASLAEDALAAARALAAGKDVILSNAVPRLTAVVDPGAFRQVLYNLLDNAIKYGPRRQRVVVGAEAGPPGSGRVSVWVQDQGLGIPAGQESAIFEPFVRLERDRNSAVAGSGLGLAVVRHLVAAHNGHIRVESAGDGGTRFVIDLPAAGVGVPEPVATPERLAPSDLSTVTACRQCLGGRCLLSPAAQELRELDSLTQPLLHDDGAADHLARDLGDLRWAGNRTSCKTSPPSRRSRCWSRCGYERAAV